MGQSVGALCTILIHARLLNTSRRTCANLTSRKSITESVIDPDIRITVWILINHSEPIRGRINCYGVSPDNVMAAVLVNLDAVAARSTKSTIYYEIEIGAGQQNSAACSDAGENVHSHSRDDVVIGIHDIYPVRRRRGGTQLMATHISKGVMAAPVHGKE
jgi:hypothetical protein